MTGIWTKDNHDKSQPKWPKKLDPYISHSWIEFHFICTDFSLHRLQFGLYGLYVGLHGWYFDLHGLYFGLHGLYFGLHGLCFGFISIITNFNKLQTNSQPSSYLLTLVE